MHKIGLLIISKNNYDLISHWKNNYNYQNNLILNIDDGSTPENKAHGKILCEELNINFLEANKPGIQNNIIEAANFFEKNGINWILYQHHDSFPLSGNLFDTLEKITNNKNINNFGVIGFNVLDSINDDLKFWNKHSAPLRTTARSPLELGDGWYRCRFGSRVNYKYFTKPFAVESVMWSVALINIDNYKRHIVVDNNFQFFHAWDDIAFQFLKKNIFNVVIPYVHFAHDQAIKRQHKIPFSSANANEKTREFFWGHFNHLDVWKKKWLFEYNLSKYLVSNVDISNKKSLKYKFFKYIGCNHMNFLETVARKTFKMNINHYKNTLLQDFFYNDPKKGPLTTFDL